MLLSQKDKAIFELQEKANSSYSELDVAYQRIMELEERMKSISQENDRLRYNHSLGTNRDFGDSSIDFSRLPDNSNLLSE